MKVVLEIVFDFLFVALGKDLYQHVGNNVVASAAVLVLEEVIEEPELTVRGVLLVLFVVRIDIAELLLFVDVVIEVGLQSLSEVLILDFNDLGSVNRLPRRPATHHFI
jgi:hypothetical protein